MLEVITDAVTGEVTTREYTPLPPTADQMRSERDYLLVNVVDPVVTNPLRWGDLSEEEKKAWAEYRRALLDVPNQAGFPSDVVWPTKP